MKFLISLLFLFFLISCGKDSEIITQRIEESSESMRVLSHCSTTGNLRYYKLFLGNNGFIGVFNSRTSIFFNEEDAGESDVKIINRAVPARDCFIFIP